MHLLISSACSSPLARFGSLARVSRLQPLLQCSRRMSSETSGTSHSSSAGAPINGLFVGPWDTNNRVRSAGAAMGIAGALGMVFDTFYRRATKQELNQVQEKLEAKIDGLTAALLQTNQHIDTKLLQINQHIDAKIDGLTNALLHTNQRDKIAAETENRELHREIEALKREKLLETKSTKGWF